VKRGGASASGAAIIDELLAAPLDPA